MVKIKITTYEQDRLEHFTNLMKGTQKTYNRFYKKFKDAPYLSAEAQVLSDAGRELQFYKDVVEMLENGYRKQKEGEWVEQVRVTKEGKVLLRHYKCNLCGVYLATQANFCPNCGAKMKGDA